MCVCISATNASGHSSEQGRLQLSSPPITRREHLHVCICVCASTHPRELCVPCFIFLRVSPTRPWGYRQLGDCADGITYDMRVCARMCVFASVCVCAVCLGPSGLPSDRPGLPLLSVALWGAGGRRERGPLTFRLSHLQLEELHICWMLDCRVTAKPPFDLLLFLPHKRRRQ